MWDYASTGQCIDAVCVLLEAIPARLDDGWNFGRRNRFAEEVTLHFIAAFRRNIIKLRDSLHALGRSTHAEALSEADDRPDDHLRAFSIRQIANERLIDLQLVEREAAQIAQRRVAGAEIIQRDPQTERAKLVQCLCRLDIVREQNGLRDFKLQPSRRKFRFGQGGREDFQQPRAAELDGGHIDRDFKIVRPQHRLPTGFLNHPFAMRDDDADLLGHGNKLLRRHQAVLRMNPAQESLEAAYLVESDNEYRLVEEQEFLQNESFPQL